MDDIDITIYDTEKGVRLIVWVASRPAHYSLHKTREDALVALAVLINEENLVDKV